MGKLLDPNFWQDAMNELWKVRPLPGVAMEDKEVRSFFEIACRALDGVIHDPEYAADVSRIEEAHNRFVEGSKGIAAIRIRDFLDDCIAFDRPLILASKFSEAQTVAILSRMHELARYITNPEFSRDGFHERMAKLKEVVCAEARKLRSSEKQEIDKIGVTIDAISGFALISVDIAKANLGDLLGLASVAGGIASFWKAARPFFQKS